MLGIFGLHGATGAVRAKRNLRPDLAIGPIGFSDIQADIAQALRAAVTSRTRH